MEEIEKKVLQRILPGQETRKRIEKAVNELSEMLKKRIEEYGEKIEVLLVGSVARDTFLRDSKDIDLFLLFPESYSREMLEKRGIEIGMSVLKGELKYAEHPYVHGSYKGFDVDVVPCYKVKDPSKKLSAVDRTPFHNTYVIEHLKEEQKNEVRLLKRFLKGLGIYGAEAAVQGFSGYLCELLIIKFGTFRDVLKAAKDWRANVHMWLENEPKKRFEEPLVFIDPVDPGRNVASAVSLESLSLFIVAAQRYLEKPDIKFFFPKRKDVSQRRAREEVKRYVENASTALLCVHAQRPEKTDDIVAPQVKKMERVIVQQLGIGGFRVLRSTSFFNEKDVWVFLELEARYLPSLYFHTGPFVWIKNSEDFLKKYKRDERVFVKPFISGGRWVVGLINPETDALAFVKNHLKEWNLGKDISGQDMEVMEAIELKQKDALNKLLAFLMPKLPWE